jgi:hypothetical protein
MALLVVARAAPVLKLIPAPSQLFRNQLFAWFWAIAKLVLHTRFNANSSIAHVFWMRKDIMELNK